MAFLKSLSFIVILILIFAVGGAGYVLYNLNTLAKPISERIATKAIGTRVSIGNMDIALKDKTVTVSNIRIANPPGYKKPHAITIDAITIALNSAGKELVNFKDIKVSGTNAYLEVTPNGTNLQDLQKRMKAGKSNTKTSKAIKVIIDRIATSKATLHPSITLLGEQDLKPITIPALNLRGIGKKQNGVLAEDAVKQIMTPLLKSLSKSASGAGFYKGLSADTLKDIGEGQIKSVKDKIGKELGVDTDQVTKGLKSLFD